VIDEVRALVIAGLAEESAAVDLHHHRQLAPGLHVRGLLHPVSTAWARPLTRGTTLPIPNEPQLAVRVVKSLSLVGFDVTDGRGTFSESDGHRRRLRAWSSKLAN
jgi:hypothetical protein